jgi:hypothetical protein
MRKYQFIGILAFLSVTAHAENVTSLVREERVSTPACMDHGRNIPVNNSEVVHWKSNTQNQFLARGHILGTVDTVYSDKNGHNHFSVRIGSCEECTIEVIYNVEFGDLPELKAGMQIEACGDYITSFAPSGPYPASPDGAILHWVHRNPRGGHPSGYVMVDGKVYGQNFELLVQ